jgi:hypothetical protein
VANESGRKVSYGLGRETTPGTAVAPTYWVKHLEGDFHQRSKKEVNPSSLGVLDNSNGAEVMEDWGEGKIGGKITDRSIVLILAAWFGATPTTTTNPDASTTVKDHTLGQSQSNEPLSLTMALKDANRDERYPMTRLADFEVNIEVGKWAMWSASFMSKKPTSSAGNTVAYVAENEFKAKHVTVKLATALAGLGAASAVNLKSIKITSKSSLAPYYTLGSNDPYNIFASERDITGEFTILFDSITHRDSFLNNNYQAMRIDLVNTDVIIGTAANPRFKIDFARCNFDDWSVDQKLNGMVEQTIKFQAHYSLADGNSATAVVTNLVASY